MLVGDHQLHPGQATLFQAGHEALPEHLVLAVATSMVGISPDNAVVILLVGAVPLDMHDERIAGDRRYLSEGSMAKLYEVSNNEDLDAIHSAE